MGDLIRRQDALNIASSLNIKSESYVQYNQGVNNYCAEIANLPTIEPRAKGAWIEVYDNSVGGHNSYSCSNCGLTIVTNPGYLKKYKFCFACGADLREVAE